MSVEVAVIINSFNRLSLLRDSISSLVAQLSKSELNYSIVIFDANSTDGSIEWLNEFIGKNLDQRIHLLTASKDEPDSFSYGVNKASEFAISQYPFLKYLFLYETDNYIFSYEPLLRAKRMLDDNKDLAACGFTVKKFNGSNAGLGAAFPSLTSFVFGQQLSFKLKLNEPQINWQQTPAGAFSLVDIVYTSPLLIKTSSWNKVNGFDCVNFPFSDCDIDLAYRIKVSGEKMGVVETSDVVHDNKEVKSVWSSKRTFSFYKARFIYFDKHYGFRAHLLKPLLFVMHGIEFGMLLLLWTFRKKKSKALKVRWALMLNVFNGYKQISK